MSKIFGRKLGKISGNLKKSVTFGQISSYMTIFGQYKEKLKGIGGRKAPVKFRRNYEDLERSCVNKKY